MSEKDTAVFQDAHYILFQGVCFLSYLTGRVVLMIWSFRERLSFLDSYLHVTYNEI